MWVLRKGRIVMTTSRNHRCSIETGLSQIQQEYCATAMREELSRQPRESHHHHDLIAYVVCLLHFSLRCMWLAMRYHHDVIISNHDALAIMVNGDGHSHYHFINKTASLGVARANRSCRQPRKLGRRPKQTLLNFSDISISAGDMAVTAAQCSAHTMRRRHSHHGHSHDHFINKVCWSLDCSPTIIGYKTSWLVHRPTCRLYTCMLHESFILFDRYSSQLVRSRLLLHGPRHWELMKIINKPPNQLRCYWLAIIL